jgi:hypothetical protein
LMRVMRHLRLSAFVGGGSCLAMLHCPSFHLEVVSGREDASLRLDQRSTFPSRRRAARPEGGGLATDDLKFHAVIDRLDSIWSPQLSVQLATTIFLASHSWISQCYLSLFLSLFLSPSFSHRVATCMRVFKLLLRGGTCSGECSSRK